MEDGVTLRCTPSVWPRTSPLLTEITAQTRKGDLRGESLTMGNG